MSCECVTDVTVTCDITFCPLCLSSNGENRNRNSKQNKEKNQKNKIKKKENKVKLSLSFTILTRIWKKIEIKFWDYLVNIKWSLHQLVYNNVTNTKVATRLHLATSVNTLYSKSILLCLNVIRESTSHTTKSYGNLLISHSFISLFLSFSYVNSTWQSPSQPHSHLIFQVLY